MLRVGHRGLRGPGQGEAPSRGAGGLLREAGESQAGPWDLVTPLLWGPNLSEAACLFFILRSLQSTRCAHLFAGSL